MLRQTVHSVLLLLLALLAACTRLEPPGPDQPLIVGLPADPVFQQLSPPTEGLQGFSRDLVGLFAESMDVQVKFVTAPDQPALLDMLASGKVHMAAAIPDKDEHNDVLFSSTLKVTRQIIAQHADSLPVGTPDKLAGREIAVRPGAAQIQTLRALQLKPPSVIIEQSAVDELELLEGLARRRFELVATDDLHFSVAANLHPDLSIALELPGKLGYAWAFDQGNEALRKHAQRFIDTAAADGTLRRLDDRYFGHIRRLDTRDIQIFLEHVRGRLPEFRHAFHDAQEITGIDWRLIAAIAYQESKWDPSATSFTNVRGMMMLTEDTADRLGVTNRLDAGQSIRAGAKYLVMLMDDLPSEIKQPDRLWFALAAYNLGMGHLRGARTFAAGLKRDPNSWMDMKQVLPLMSRPEYYERLKSGRARGGEAVILVENIRNYFDVLSRLEPIWTPPSIAKEKPVAKKPPKKKSAKRR
ncbi:membrane-bound lytic murein transglycosylase MltF [Rhodocyclaceae bacterium]